MFPVNKNPGAPGFISCYCKNEMGLSKTAGQAKSGGQR
jgi:hypothetical protein